MKLGVASFFSFKGRMNRSSYIAHLFGYYLTSIIVAVVGSALPSTYVFKIAALCLLVFIFLVIPLLQVVITARRLHDIDKRGWWMLVSVPGFIIIAILGSYHGPSPSLIIRIPLLFLVLVTLFFVVMVLARKGTEGANRFGPPQ